MDFRRRKIRVHQYHSGTAKGDGVTNGMFFVRSLLREFGFDSEIFCSHPDLQLGDEVRHISKWGAGAEVLLVHHSMGIDDEPWLLAVSCKKILVYHNITPPEFFANQPSLADYAERGLHQARRWRPMFEAVIADSEQNKNDLLELGYASESIDVVPLLPDMDALRRIAPDERFLATFERYFNVVFVGRLAENKSQHEVVLAYARSHVRRSRASRLIFAGGTSSESYVSQIESEAERLGVAEELVLTGKISDSELVAIYRTANVFVCLSKHEGFGIPLAEAMLFDVPIVALAKAAVPWTLGKAGIQFQQLDVDEIAVAIDFIAQNPALRSKMITAQRDELARFERLHLAGELGRVLEKLGIHSNFAAPVTAIGRGKKWRIEGPFDSTYSLAILNRNLGRALVRRGVDVEYKSSEGGGDFTASADFLRANPDIGSRLAEVAQPRPAVVLRNLYPPRCTRMEGAVNTFALYGWEESTFPFEWAEAFNQNLDLITTTSKFVTKTLIDSGVKTPIRTVGDGTNHYLDVPLEALGEPLADGFRFLHNSSCFPRKGVDALLAAYGRYFSGRSDVVLIIKTFPNPHNDIAARVADFRAQFPSAPAVQLLMGDLSDGQMASLYTHCQALVAPSRGEGFGLPLAEAMLRGIPVITTAYGGQMDFCSEETAYLVDYRFAYSQSHFEEPASIWADPDVDSLGKAMLEVIDGDVGKRKSRTAKARELLMQRFTWDAVAERQSHAIAEIGAAPLGELPVAVRTAWISTWKTRCGIASYSDFLTQGWHKDRLWVLADQQEAAPENLPNVRRCWRQGSADAGKQLLSAVLALDIDAVVIQYNFGFYPLQALAELIEGLVNRGKICLLTLHATKDVDKPDLKASLGDISDTLARCTRILVHSLADCNRLKQFGLVDNVILFPHGAPVPQSLPARVRSGPFTVGTFGYALPHKGLREVIESCAQLRQRGLDVALRMLNSRYPAAQSDEEIAACRALIASRLDDKHAEFDDAFHSDVKIAETLSRCDLLVFAYQKTTESASGAIRVAMSAGVPILCTPLEIFDDVTSAVDFSMESTPDALSASIAGFIEDASRGRGQLERRRRWLEKVSWPVLSTRLANLLESLAFANTADEGSKQKTFLPDLVVEN